MATLAYCFLQYVKKSKSDSWNKNKTKNKENTHTRKKYPRNGNDGPTVNVLPSAVICFYFISFHIIMMMFSMQSLKSFHCSRSFYYIGPKRPHTLC